MGFSRTTRRQRPPRKRGPLPYPAGACWDYASGWLVSTALQALRLRRVHEVAPRTDPALRFNPPAGREQRGFGHARDDIQSPFKLKARTILSDLLRIQHHSPAPVVAPSRTRATRHRYTPGLGWLPARPSCKRPVVQTSGSASVSTAKGALPYFSFKYPTTPRPPA